MLVLYLVGVFKALGTFSFLVGFCSLVGLVLCLYSFVNIEDYSINVKSLKKTVAVFISLLVLCSLILIFIPGENASIAMLMEYNGLSYEEAKCIVAGKED